MLHLPITKDNCKNSKHLLYCDFDWINIFINNKNKMTKNKVIDNSYYMALPQNNIIMLYLVSKD